MSLHLHLVSLVCVQACVVPSLFAGSLFSSSCRSCVPDLFGFLVCPQFLFCFCIFPCLPWWNTGPDYLTNIKLAKSHKELEARKVRALLPLTLMDFGFELIKTASVCLAFGSLCLNCDTIWPDTYTKKNSTNTPPFSITVVLVLVWSQCPLWNQFFQQPKNQEKLFQSITDTLLVKNKELLTFAINSAAVIMQMYSLWD